MKKKKSEFPHFDVNAAAKVFAQFCETIAALRHPKSGCPWDLEQDHKTLRRYMLEEAYEAADVMGGNEWLKIAEELGDVLLQVVLNAQIAADARHFTILDVIGSIDAKMRRRHPHVFANKSKRQIPIDEVWRVYQNAKNAEKKSKAKVGLFHSVRHSPLPATLQALKIGEIAHRIGFDWKDENETFEQFLSEVFELRDGLRNKDRKNIEEELGDVYFTLAHVCRHVGVNPENIAFQGNQKFLRRFAKMEELAKKRNINLTKAKLPEQEELWRLAKVSEKKKRR